MSEAEDRARIARAIATHGAGSVSARLNADGTVEVVVPTNDLEHARTKRREKGKKWRGVTNELVVAHANPDCAACSGHGYTGPEEAGEVCKCAEEMFEVAYKTRMRWNVAKSRVEVFA